MTSVSLRNGNLSPLGSDRAILKRILIIIFFQFGCVVATLYDVFSGGAHAVLYDEDKTSQQNDQNYYFKNSYPNEPYIMVPENRMTYWQYKKLDGANRRGQFTATRNNIQRILGHNISTNLKPNQTYWIICDQLFTISIRRK